MPEQAVSKSHNTWHSLPAGTSQSMRGGVRRPRFATDIDLLLLSLKGGITPTGSAPPSLPPSLTVAATGGWAGRARAAARSCCRSPPWTTRSWASTPARDCGVRRTAQPKEPTTEHLHRRAARQVPTKGQTAQHHPPLALCLNLDSPVVMSGLPSHAPASHLSAPLPLLLQVCLGLHVHRRQLRHQPALAVGIRPRRLQPTHRHQTRQHALRVNQRFPEDVARFRLW